MIEVKTIDKGTDYQQEVISGETPKDALNIISMLERSDRILVELNLAECERLELTVTKASAKAQLKALPKDTPIHSVYWPTYNEMKLFRM